MQQSAASTVQTGGKNKALPAIIAVAVVVLLLGGAVGGHFMELYTLPMLPQRVGGFESTRRERPDDDGREQAAQPSDSTPASVAPSTPTESAPPSETPAEAPPGQHTPEPAAPEEIRLSNMGITNAQLTEMVASGEIPGNVQTLYLGGNRISDLAPLSGLTELTWLSLYENQIMNVTPLSELTNLKFLNLSANQINNISPLRVLTSLESLYLFENQLRDISPLSGMTRLMWLGLDDNQISDISPLSGLTYLFELGLDDNNISDLTPLSGLTRLSELYVSYNRVSDLTPLSGLTNLTLLTLAGNPISDWSPVAHLPEVYGRPETTPDQGQQGSEDERIIFMARFLRSAIDDGSYHDVISVYENPDNLFIRISSDFLFDSGSAHINNDAYPLLYSIIRATYVPEAVFTFDGHTDNVPISTAQFPSNRHLSDGRATAVSDVFISVGVSPSAVSIMASGDSSPIGSNDTVEGRQNNRRIEITVSFS